MAALAAAVGRGGCRGLVDDDVEQLVGVVGSWMLVIGPKHAGKDGEANIV